MADRRRRVKKNVSHSEDSECESDVLNSSVDAKKGDDVPETDDQSEYESAEEIQDDEETEEETDDDDDEEEEDDEDEEEETDDEEEDVDDESVVVETSMNESEIVDEERQDGDGQEQPDENKKNLDDDEDRKNPAYVPRRGAFYEHDNRLHGEGQEEAVVEHVEEPEETRPKNKKLWKDDEKWFHDKFRQDQQAPKSKEELVAIYGYDIRSCDKPPDEPPKRFQRPEKPRSQTKQQLGDFINEKEAQPHQRRNRNEDGIRRNERYREDGGDGFSYQDRRRRNDREPRFQERDRNERNRRGTGRGGRGMRGGRGGRAPRRDFNRDGESERPHPRSSTPEFQRTVDNKKEVRTEVIETQSPRQPDKTTPNTQPAEDRVNELEHRLKESWPKARSKTKNSNYNNSRSNNRTEQVTPKSKQQWTNSSYRSSALNQQKFESQSDSPSEQRAESPLHENEVETLVIEKKSYSRERRVRAGSGRTRIPESSSNHPSQSKSDKPVSPRVSKSAATGVTEEESGTRNDTDKNLKQEGSRPKRYSSQRQRNLPEPGYAGQEPVYYPAFQFQPGGPGTTSSPPQENRFPPPGFPPGMGYPIPVSASGQTSQHARMYSPPNATSSNQGMPALIPAQYVMGYMGAPPPQYQLVGQMPLSMPPPIQGQGPMIPNQQPPPQQQGNQPATSREMYSHGTTYYNPEQQPHVSPTRSPVRRPKAAIPIVNPQVGQETELNMSEAEQPVQSPTTITIVGESIETKV